jgi:hypothetical protein
MKAEITGRGHERDNIREVSQATYWKRRVGAAALSLALVLGVAKGAKSISNHVDPPIKSFGQQTVYVQTGDTLYGIMDERIQGIQNVDPRKVEFNIENDEKNAEALSDGLTPGDEIVMPLRVKKE